MKGSLLFCCQTRILVRIVLVAMTVACNIWQTHILTLPKNQRFSGAPIGGFESMNSAEKQKTSHEGKSFVLLPN